MRAIVDSILIIAAAWLIVYLFTPTRRD